MLMRVASKAASAAHHLLVKVKAAAVIGLLDAQQHIIDLAFAEQQSAAWKPDHEPSAPAANAEQALGNDAGKISGVALNPETTSLLRSADGSAQAGGMHSSSVWTFDAWLQHAWVHLALLWLWQCN